MQEIKRPQFNLQDARLRNKLTNIERPEVEKNKINLKKLYKIIGIILVILILSISIFWILIQNQKYISKNWQAVFLSDGQVYFGKIVKQDKQDLILKDIYYLREKGSLQQGENSLNKITQDVSLIKLGTEIHGPEDEMRINRFHILFIEELKEYSKIVSAI